MGNICCSAVSVFEESLPWSFFPLVQGLCGVAQLKLHFEHPFHKLPYLVIQIVLKAAAAPH